MVGSGRPTPQSGLRPRAGLREGSDPPRLWKELRALGVEVYDKEKEWRAKDGHPSVQLAPQGSSRRSGQGQVEIRQGSEGTISLSSRTWVLSSSELPWYPLPPPPLQKLEWN